MKRSLALTAVAMLAVGWLPPHAGAQSVSDSDFRLKTVANLDFPVGMQFTKSGARLFVNEREGRIRIIKNGKLLATPFATVNTTTANEGGLLGLALHPQFESGQPWVYVFYTEPDGSHDRIARFRASGDRAVSSESLFQPMPASGYHHGGSVAFGADGKLYVSNGEQHVQSRAQNEDALGGKIYRLNADGSIPSDNPFGTGNPNYALGLRNPFGMTVDPNGGRIWVTENGPNEDDEVNLIVRGENYGWPEVTGPDGSGGYRDPILNYQNIIVPTMMAFGGSALPSAYRGNLFFGTYGQETIHRVRLNSARTDATSDSIFIRPGQGVVGMTMGPDGLYYTTPTKVVRAYVPAAPAPAPAPTPKPSPKKTTPKPTPSPTPTPTPTPTPSSPTPTASSLAAPKQHAGGSSFPWLWLGVGVAVLGGFATRLALKRNAEKP